MWTRRSSSSHLGCGERQRDRRPERPYRLRAERGSESVAPHSRGKLPSVAARSILPAIPAPFGARRFSSDGKRVVTACIARRSAATEGGGGPHPMTAPRLPCSLGQDST